MRGRGVGEERWGGRKVRIKRRYEVRIASGVRKCLTFFSHW